MNTMAIETATQNFLIGQVVMMDIYTDDDFVLAFVILYPLIILFISVSFKEKCGPLGSRFSFFGPDEPVLDQLLVRGSLNRSSV